MTHHRSRFARGSNCRSDSRPHLRLPSRKRATLDFTSTAKAALLLESSVHVCSQGCQQIKVIQRQSFRMYCVNLFRTY